MFRCIGRVLMKLMWSRGIGNAKEVMGHEAANQYEPLELPW
jgi:hypothetical protein